MKTRVLAAQPIEIVASDGIEVRPLSRQVNPGQAIRDAFIAGSEVVVLTDVPLDESDLSRGLFELLEADALAWLDPRPLGASQTVFRLRDQLVPPHVAAVALRKHTWDALGNHARCRRVRAAVVELAMRTARAGLDVVYRDAQASPGWSMREGGDVVRGWMSGILFDPGR